MSMMFLLGPCAWRISIWIQMRNGLFWVYCEYIIYWAFKGYWASWFRWFSTLPIFYITEKYLQSCKIDFRPHLQLLSCQDCVRDNSECCESSFRQEMQRINSNQSNQIVNCIDFFFWFSIADKSCIPHLYSRQEWAECYHCTFFFFYHFKRDCGLISCCTRPEFEVAGYRRCAACLHPAAHCDCSFMFYNTLLECKTDPLSENDCCSTVLS